MRSEALFLVCDDAAPVNRLGQAQLAYMRVAADIGPVGKFSEKIVSLPGFFEDCRVARVKAIHELVSVLLPGKCLRLQHGIVRKVADFRMRVEHRTDPQRKYDAKRLVLVEADL